jgi:hypothetical protein
MLLSLLPSNSWVVPLARLQAACASKFRNGGYGDPATEEAREAFSHYTMSLSYPTPGNPVPDPSTLRNWVIDFELRWLEEHHPELLRHATCYLERPRVWAQVTGSIAFAASVAAIGFGFFGNFALLAVVLALVVSSLWCCDQWRRYSREVWAFCVKHLDHPADG